MPLDLTLEPLEDDDLPKLDTGVESKVDVDLSETELGTIYAPSFTSPVPLAASGGVSKPMPALDMPAIPDGKDDDDIPSLMDFELPEDPPAPPKPKT